MSDVKLRKSIRTTIRSILLEEKDAEKQEPQKEKPKEEPQKEKPKEKPKKKPKAKGAPGTIRIASGAVGSGRFSRFVADAKARAQKDPAGLMKELGVKSASGSSDLQRVLSVINAAIHTNVIMGEAYAGASLSTEKTADGGSIEVIAVYPSGLKRRDGIKYLSHTLTGAKNAGVLALQGAIEFNKGTSAPIVIYST